MSNYLKQFYNSNSYSKMEDVRHNGDRFVDPKSWAIFKTWKEGYTTRDKHIADLVDLILGEELLEYIPVDEELPDRDQKVWLCLLPNTRVACVFSVKMSGKSPKFRNLQGDQTWSANHPDIIGWLPYDLKGVV